MRCAAALLGATSLLAAGAASARQPWGRDYFPNVSLTTQDGKVVRLYDDLLKDKVVAIDLIYTHCHFACPLETARLAEVQRLLGDRVGKEIFFYSITLDPKRDTPAALKAYAERYRAGPGWVFLTGSPDDIKLVARKLGLFFDGPSAVRDGHTPDLMIGNVATGQWMKNSAVDNPRLLARTITTLLDGYRKPVAPERSYTEARELSISKGEYLFSTKCAVCHTLGDGDGIGPDVLGVTRARDRAWLARYVAAPDRMLAEGDPIARDLYAKYNQVNMPNLSLGKDEVAAVLDYIDARSAAGRKEPGRVGGALAGEGIAKP
ncbi:MAG TPA: SCO family protein [Anaeromyxobacteraceae bacterium]|nr:SCO family protein [Anaeromyxobacteraceae bacterium]